MWEKIKRFFGFLDANNDGRVNAEDVVFAQAVAEAEVKKVKAEVTEVVEEVKARVEAVKEEVADVKVAAVEVVNQVGDIAKAAAGKSRPGRKKKK